MRLQLLAVLASLAGIGISAYLTVAHYSPTSLACPASGLFNCEMVLSSSYGVIEGSNVPTAAGGIVWFAMSAGLAASLWRRPRSVLAKLQLAWAGIGLLTVLYLVYIEIVKLGAICAWCSVAHILVLSIFLIALPRPEGDRVG